MPLQNRVRPDGEIFASAARGTFLGNRGVLHDEHKRIVRHSRGDLWLICRLEFKGRKQELMHPRRYTQLFFLDEAVGLAAGHRPCGECRAKNYRAYLDAVNADNQAPILSAGQLNTQLSESRRAPRPTAAIASLPDGTFVSLGDNDFRLIWQGSLHRWTPGGYTDRISLADLDVAEAAVVTPALSVEALRLGYPVTVHPSADGTKLGNVRNFMRSLDHLFAGTIPDSKSAANTNSFVYKEFLNHDISPALRHYTEGVLRQLIAINPAITMENRRLVRDASSRMPVSAMTCDAVT